MKKVLILLILVSGILFAHNDVPSCYDALHIKNPNVKLQKEIFILVDQTTILDKKIMIYVYKNMMKFIKNGYGVTIASFSSNAKGKYTDVVYSGVLENILPKDSKDDIPKKTLRRYQGCMNGQYKFAKKKATKALVRTLKGANKALPHSDIIKSLADISKHIIAVSLAEKKVVLVVSDMVEHSSITTFYKKGNIKNIDVAKEMQKVKKSGYVADFRGANVYVVGTGMVGKNAYQNAKKLTALTDFWKSYFKKSNANLKAIGTPMLLEDVE